MTILAEYTEQATVDNWPARILWVLIVLAIIGLGIWGMRRGWVNRQRRQADIPAPIDHAPADAIWIADVAGTYLGSARADDWLDRIAVHDLGVPSRVQVSVGDCGIWLDRTGARSVYIPRDVAVSARVDRGAAGEVRDKGSVVIVRWRLGDALIESGVRPGTAEDQRRLCAALDRIGVHVQMEASA